MTYQCVLADGVYQNSDLDKFNFYYTIDDNLQLCAAQSLKSNLLKNASISREIYFRPSTYPFINPMDIAAGSAFDRVVIPTASQKVTALNGRCWVSEDTFKLHLLEYKTEIDCYLREFVQTVFQKHKSVTLAFSGGIDSLVLLSYIIAAGYGPRTSLFTVINHTQHDPSCLHKNNRKLAALYACLEQLTRYVEDITVEHFDQGHLTDIVNRKGYYDLVCYTTSFIMNHQKCKEAVLHGAAGNGALLHYYRQTTEILACNPLEIANLTKLQKIPGQYTESMYSANVDPGGQRFSNRSYWHKPYLNLNSKHILYVPFYSERVSRLLRNLDYSNVGLDVIFNATFAREIIARNTGTLLSQFITTEGIKDLDNLESVIFDLSSIDQNALHLPNALNHNPEGISFLQHELKVAQQTGVIPLNSVVSIKNLQNIQDQLRG